jgi:hypothetical protein
MGRPKKHVEVASVAKVEAPTLAELQAKIESLSEQLAVSESKRSKAEKKALAEADAEARTAEIPMQGRATGKTVRVERCKGFKTVSYTEKGMPIRQPVMHMVDVPTYFYRIDMAPCGGICLKINGDEFYHGTTYEMDIDTLRTVKDLVYRTWKHDSDIHGSDENFYRQKNPGRLSARGMA